VSSRSETFLSWVLTISAVVIAGVTVGREVTDRRERVDIPNPNDPPTLVGEWEKLPAEGILVGNSSAPVMVVEFSDLECPFCRRFHEQLLELRQAFKDKVAYTFIHFPLNGHRNAYAAARAAECAYSQGRFEAFISAVFSTQDSLGQKAWSRYGREAMVPDSAEFARCSSDTARVERVDRGRALGSLLKVRGTPTVIVNGWRFATPPTDTQLRRVVNDLLNGRELFGK